MRITDPAPFRLWKKLPLCLSAVAMNLGCAESGRETAPSPAEGIVVAGDDGQPPAVCWPYREAICQRSDAGVDNDAENSPSPVQPSNTLSMVQENYQALVRKPTRSNKHCNSGWSIESTEARKFSAWVHKVWCKNGNPVETIRSTQYPDYRTQETQRIPLSRWNSIWAHVESTPWRTLLECTYQPNDNSHGGWDVEIRDGFGGRVFRGGGTPTGICGKLAAAVAR